MSPRAEELHRERTRGLPRSPQARSRGGLLAGLRVDPPRGRAGCAGTHPRPGMPIDRGAARLADHERVGEPRRVPRVGAHGGAPRPREADARLLGRREVLQVRRQDRDARRAPCRRRARRRPLSARADASQAPLGVREALAWTAAAAAVVAAVTLGVSSGSSLTKSQSTGPRRPVAVVPLSAGLLLPADISRTMANGATVKVSASGAIIAQTQRVVVQPGAAEPWHVHSGSALATLASGT